ncbi:LAMI_0E02894g1_1 [Lachancea mirantina]|uniref:Ribosomal RNA-processing protein 42 n=1 Tax=Lachancea mirantina TaxID=1230905 RepID=A0A1G4JJM5_9SACH|nr:LAMI_0E02894g1_1 [Lachancea mirantina]
MSLSVTEKSYLHDSLCLDPPARPDGRVAHQLRPIEIFTDFLPACNGSAKISASDGSECVVSVKAKVVERALEEELILVDVDVAGQRDDSPFVHSIASLLTKVLNQKIHQKNLRLTQKYAFKLFVDVLVLSSKSHPLSLISFAVYSALKATYLPKLISSDDDLEVAELPTFHDYDMVKLDVDPPLLFTTAVIGNNAVIDPAHSESEVACSGILVTWSKGKVTAPIRTIGLNDEYVTGIDVTLLEKSIELVEKTAPAVVKALDGL